MTADPAGADPILVTGTVEAADLVSGAAGGGVVFATPIAAAASTLRRAPVFIDATAVLPRWRATLEDCLGQVRQHTPERHLLTLAEPLLVGQGTVLVPGSGGHRLLADSAREFLWSGAVPDGLRQNGAGGMAVDGPVQRRVERRCLLLQRPWWNNFGHWLVDHAMTLAYLAHSGALRTRTLVVGGPATPPLDAVMRETIAAILPDAVVLQHPDDAAWRFRRLDYVMPLHIPPLFKLPAALDRLREAVLATAPNMAPRPRLYIRRLGGPRRLHNEAAILALAEAHGFQTLAPETLTLGEQAALFGQAEAVLGVKGAAMTNILFADPACRLMLMSPGSFVDPFFWDIASTRGIAYGEVFGPLAFETDDGPGADFRVDPAAVGAMLQAMLGNRA